MKIVTFIWHVIAASSVATLAISSGYQLWGREPVIDYGPPDPRNRIEPGEVYPGQIVQLWFAQVKWIRVDCRSWLEEVAFDSLGRRFDSRHEISTPPDKPITLPPKSRDYMIPKGMAPGPAILAPVAKSECSLFDLIRPIEAVAPAVKFTVIAPPLPP
ncbi:MAG: hypothetical protein C5B50_00890 [Verrucomicrobia bacterium]|nr:MAG: hypothetical protein C5B50_00890 [Verrucomicrobiota bacterium]